MELLFVVTYEGIYRHEILGVFDNLREAIRNCRKFILQEQDGYHDVHISKTEKNKPVKDVETIIVFTRKILKKINNTTCFVDRNKYDVYFKKNFSKIM